MFCVCFEADGPGIVVQADGIMNFARHHDISAQTNPERFLYQDVKTQIKTQTGPLIEHSTGTDAKPQTFNSTKMVVEQKHFTVMTSVSEFKLLKTCALKCIPMYKPKNTEISARSGSFYKCLQPSQTLDIIGRPSVSLFSLGEALKKTFILGVSIVLKPKCSVGKIVLLKNKT